MTNTELVQSELRALQERQNALMENPRIKKYLKLVDEWMESTQGRKMTIHEKRNAAQCLHNAIIDTGLKAGTKLFEATTEDSISFLGIQLPVIAALLPSLAMNEVAVVQALDRRIGAVFYLDVKYGSDKGHVSANDTMIGAKTGHSVGKSGRRYAMARVVYESIGTGNGKKTGTVEYAPGLINLENVKLHKVSNIGTLNESATLLGSSDSSGNITGDYIDGTGTITAAGAYDITFTGLDSDDTIYITYDYQYDLPTDTHGDKKGVPEVNVAVTQSTVEAIDFPLRAQYSIGAQIDLQKAHGLDLESELVKYLGSEVKFTIDQVGLDMIDEAAASSEAADPPTDWDAKIQSGQEWLWKKHEFLDRIEQGSNNIFAKTKRGIATFIHCGNNVARVIRQFPPEQFKPVAGLGSTPPTGPMKIGELVGRTVIQNPFKPTNYYTLGFRGDHYLYAGFIYCPYIPLFTTPTLITSDLMAQKGFLSSAGFKVINPGLFCQGLVKNLGAQA
ncbi:MAG: hypothetical protein ACTSUO_08545 [Candidatus Thorarchaeota archaeon]